MDTPITFCYILRAIGLLVGLAAVIWLIWVLAKPERPAPRRISTRRERVKEFLRLLALIAAGTAFLAKALKSVFPWLFE